jgi:hypothetical protein
VRSQWRVALARSRLPHEDDAVLEDGDGVATKATMPKMTQLR